MTATRRGSEILESEAHFHDRWAEGVELHHIPVREAFESPTAVENRFILRRMGGLRGKRLLDIGVGLGESAVYFGLQGARVTIVDVSPQMVETAMKLGHLHGVSVNGVVCPAEALEVPSDSYDLVYVANTIHHVTDQESFFAEIARVLRPGGRFFSWDPLAYNPVINVYRKMATAVRTEDEHPLTFGVLALARKHFAGVEHREFWLASLVLFLKYYLVDRVHPNEDRYWKRILRETSASLWWWYPLHAADVVLTRVPLVKRLAWNMVIWGEKASSLDT